MSESTLDGRLVILGCGNIHYGDDCFGCKVAAILKKEIRPVPEGVRIIDAGTGGPRLVNLLNSLPDPPEIIIIDTGHQGKDAGELSVIEKTGVYQRTESGTSHTLRPESVLDGYRGKCTLILCEPHDTSFGTSDGIRLKEPIARAVSIVKRMIEEACL